MSLRLTPLAAALALAFITPFQVHAQTAPPDKQPGTDTALPEVTISADKDQSVPGKAYAGGKIVTGGKIGVLGNQDTMNVPFSVVSYTAEGIQNQQAKSIADALASDPTVRTGLGYGNFSELFTIRGFTLTGDSISYDGLYGIVPRQLVAVESLERIELLKGATAFLNGVSPDGTGLGGTINIVPKRATDTPINQFTVDYTGDSRLGASVDIGRRFGPDNQLGIRVNALARDGVGSIDKEGRNTRMLSLGSDLRSGNLRLSADFTYQKQTVTQGRSTVNVRPTATAAPSAPSASSNFGQPWSNSLLENTFGVVRGEYDLSPNATIYAAAGAQHANEYGTYSSPTVGANGVGTGGLLRVSNKQDTLSGETGVKLKFATGPVKHQANVSFSAMQQSVYSGFDSNPGSYAVNIYNPADVALPAKGTSNYAGGASLLDSGITSRNTLRSAAISDTLSFLDDRLMLTLGIRHQNILTKGYSAGIQSSTYNQSANSPAVGIVLKPWNMVSVYANHIEGLSKGDTAGATYLSTPVSNASQPLAPYKTKQNEVGIKLEADKIGGGISLFEIKKPTSGYSINGSTYTFGAIGEQTNRGIELTMYGDPVQGLHLNGGYSYIDAKLNKTQSGAQDGNYAPGVSKNLFNVAADWEVPQMRNLVLSANYIYTDKQYVNSGNTTTIPSWSRVDLGARYKFAMQKQTVTLRAAIENIGDKSYWVASSQYGNVLTLGNPRTFKLSATVDF
ncbi:TonB-dependent receptor [Herbaspirillum chlorophenolicum]|uniref:TonB-dependent receptor n=1 Tax=Herbaspirillum chlorophenolicum TaxID=211589 RepID=UPI0009E2CFBF|nr:TonB-dependent receptor [Herbaspirillum chlorophenolicum]